MLALRLFCALGRSCISPATSKHTCSAKDHFPICRNPIYLSLSSGFGIALNTGTLTYPLLALAALLAYFHTQVRAEEVKLLKLHGERYRAYCARRLGLYPILIFWTSQRSTLSGRQSSGDGSPTPFGLPGDWGWSSSPVNCTRLAFYRFCFASTELMFGVAVTSGCKRTVTARAQRWRRPGRTFILGLQD